MARGDHSRIPNSDRELILSKKEQLVRPGDIILVKTPNVFYDAMRKLYATEYDHVIVVVD